MPAGADEPLLQPTAVLMAIHSVDRARAPLKLQIAALNACVQLRALFPPEALAAALQQLVTRCAAAFYGNAAFHPKRLRCG